MVLVTGFDHDHQSQVAMYGECVACAAETGSAARDSAIAVAADADPDWIRRARTVIAELARTRPTVTADDVWAEIDQPVSDPRALGAVFTWAGDAGYLARTTMTVPSTRPEAHRRPIRVWQSLVYQPPRLF